MFNVIMQVIIDQGPLRFPSIFAPIDELDLASNVATCIRANNRQREPKALVGTPPLILKTSSRATPKQQSRKRKRRAEDLENVNGVEGVEGVEGVKPMEGHIVHWSQWLQKDEWVCEAVM